jgi:hypothetical protein
MEENDLCQDEEERQTITAVMHIHAGYAIIDERWNMTEEVTRRDDMR